MFVVAQSQELFKALERGQAVPVRLQGPIGLTRAQQPWMRYPVMVAVVGGIGVSLNLRPSNLSPKAFTTDHCTWLRPTPS